MRIFVTGASGWIGTSVATDLRAAGHEVLGLARSDASAARIEATGAEVLRGGLDDLDSLRAGARETDATVHLANKHDWSDPAESARAERAAVEALAETLVGTDRPLVFASGVAGLATGRPSVEADDSPFVGVDAPRGGSENRGFDFVAEGVRAISARFAPTVHGMHDHGFIALITQAAREHGVSAYVGDGTQAWSAVHVADAAHLVRLAVERAPAAARLHAVAEQAVPTRAIAEAIGERYELPTISVPAEDALDHFGFVGRFWAMDLSSSSEVTRATYDWQPTGPTLLEDIAAGAYDG